MLYESPPVHKPFIPPAEVPSRILFSRINDVFPKFFRRRGIQSHPMLYCIFLIKASLRRRHLTFGKEMTLQFLTKRYIPSPEPNTKPELYTMKVLSSLASMNPHIDIYASNIYSMLINQKINKDYTNFI